METEEVSRKWNTGGMGEVICIVISGPSTWHWPGGKISKQIYYPKLKIVLGRVNMNAVIQVFPLKGYLSQVDHGVFHLVLLPSSNQKIYMTNDNARAVFFSDSRWSLWCCQIGNHLTYSLRKVSIDVFLRHNICGMLHHNLAFKIYCCVLKFSRTFKTENFNNKCFQIVIMITKS